SQLISHPRIGSSSRAVNCAAGRMPPMAPSVPQNMTVPVTNFASPPARDIRSEGLRIPDSGPSWYFRPPAVDSDVGAQDQLLPVLGNLIQSPQGFADHLGAKLFRQRDTHRFRLAVGVIGANAKPESILHRDDHRLRLA